MSFIYTSCTTACPIFSARLAWLQRRLAGAPAARGRVQLLSITVDPERDTAEALAAYARRFGADPASWRFLREAPDRLRPVLAAYDEWTRRSPDGELDHPAPRSGPTRRPGRLHDVVRHAELGERVHLVDPRGRGREIYGLRFFDERQVALDVLALLGEAC